MCVHILSFVVGNLSISYSLSLFSFPSIPSPVSIAKTKKNSKTEIYISWCVSLINGYFPFCSEVSSSFLLISGVKFDTEADFPSFFFCILLFFCGD